LASGKALIAIREIPKGFFIHAEAFTMPESKESFNCEFFIKLRTQWQAGEADKEITHQFLRAHFPRDVDRILGWLDRSPKENEIEDNLLTMAKFDE
jgi:hypothetical protein